jgi:hypothetical protein
MREPFYSFSPGFGKRETSTPFGRPNHGLARPAISDVLALAAPRHKP